MVNLEEWMELQAMYQQGMSQSEMTRRLGLDRKTVRKYLQGPPQSYGARVRRRWRGDQAVRDAVYSNRRPRSRYAE